jgi:twitching motility protein PilT
MTCGTSRIASSPGKPMDITELLAFAAKQRASDLHLSAGLPPMIRVDGDVRCTT